MVTAGILRHSAVMDEPGLILYELADADPALRCRREPLPMYSAAWRGQRPRRRTTERIVERDVRPGDFPSQTTDKIRYGDTDRQGHVNNAVFSTFLETGRVELLHGVETLPEPGAAFVIARLVLDYRAEITWPGTVVIGTRIASIGRSSIRMEQAIFQHERCVATAETVIVQMNEATRKSHPFSEAALERLTSLGSSR